MMRVRLLQAEVREGNYKKTKQSPVVFRRTAITRDHLLQADAFKIVDLVAKEVNAARPPSATGVTHAVREFVAFEVVASFVMKVRVQPESGK